MSDEKEKTSPAQYFAAAAIWDASIKEAEGQIEEFRKRKHKIFKALEQEYGKSFKFEDKWYTIKTMKKTGTVSITEYTVPPGSWLKKPDSSLEDSKYNFELWNENGFVQSALNQEHAEQLKEELSYSCIPSIKRILKTQSES